MNPRNKKSLNLDQDFVDKSKSKNWIENQT